MTADVDAVRRALEEDIGSGDLTTNLCVPPDAMATGRMVARQALTLAGVELLPLIFPDCRTKLTRHSGDHLQDGDEIAIVQGSARALLTGERTVLNFVQRLSGIATLARAYVRAVEGTGCRILDTRKTTPGLRHLEKLAAAAGGATNHRMGLYDAVLIKNNHITAAGGVAARRSTGPATPVFRSRSKSGPALSWTKPWRVAQPTCCSTT